MIQVRKAGINDIPAIMQFIDEHWKKGHILARDRKFFEWQHVRDNEVFYIIAEDIDDGQLYGSMGYIPMSEHEGACMSTCMICSLPNSENRMLGEEMASFFRLNIKCKNVISAGMNARYANIVRVLAPECIGQLKHYYRLGEMATYNIASIINPVRLPIGGTSQFVLLKTIDEFKELMDKKVFDDDYSKRSYQYFNHRYYEHPYYKYKIYGIKESKNIRAALITREEEIGKRKVLRVIDFIGDEEPLSHSGTAIDNLLNENAYEYIDFYCYGLQHETLKNAGFNLIDSHDENIIPDYFHPYERRNIEIYFYTWNKDNIRVFKGFGDQDRPS